MRKVRLVRSQKGISLLEMLMTLGVFSTLATMAAFQIGVARVGFKGDGAMRTIMAKMNEARELALTQRRNMRVDFTGDNVIQIIRREVPAANGTTVLSAVEMEGGVRYGVTTGLPDTPDSFGNASGIAFGTATQLVFTTDGTLVNQTGTPVSGTVFVSIPGQNRSARAVTIMGATGRIRGYKWNGARWVRV